MRLAVLPLAFLLLATPAAAQINGTRQASASQREYVGTRVQGQGYRSELRQIDRRARHARQDGEITRGEARSIRRQVGLVENLGVRFAANGLTDAELEMLEGQAFALRDLAQAPTRPAPRRRRGR